MSARSRSALPFVLTLGFLAAPLLARAQDAAFAPAIAVSALRPPAGTSPSPAPAVAPASGPTVDGAAVGVRHVVDVNASAPARRSGAGPGTALMIVGGAALLVGLVIGGSAGGAIAVGGAVVGLIGLYQYLQ